MIVKAVITHAMPFIMVIIIYRYSFVCLCFWTGLAPFFSRKIWMCSHAIALCDGLLCIRWNWVSYSVSRWASFLYLYHQSTIGLLRSTIALLMSNIALLGSTKGLLRSTIGIMSTKVYYRSNKVYLRSTNVYLRSTKVYYSSNNV